MPDDIQKIAHVATRAIKDPAFAQEILDGKHDHPEVREAIIADLAAPSQSASGKPGSHLVSLADRAKSW